MKNAFIITPSWLMKNRKEFEKGIKNFEKLGFKVTGKTFPKTLPSSKEKAAQINNAFKNKNIDFIIAQRGGFSSMKILPYIDFSAIKNNPKPIAGFSDMSTLLNSIYERTGQITFHSPMIINLEKPSRFTLKSFKNALAGFPEKDLFKGAPVKVFKHGNVKGILKGGNLVTITSINGTKWEVDTDNNIIFLEDVDEKLHQVDRYLSQWILMGKLQKIKALILGDFRGIKPEAVYKLISSQIKVNFPVIHCPYLGHVKNKITIPVGAKVQLNTKAGELRLI